jgi:hypothetical protein
MVLDYNLTLSNDTIVLYVTACLSLYSHKLMYTFTRVWISSSDAAAVAAKGFRIIHAASNSFYLVRAFEQSYLFPADLTSPPLGGIGLRRRRLGGRLPRRQQLV